MWDNIPEPSLEPPEDKPVGTCSYCGSEIYEGELVYEIDGDLIHEDCLTDYAAWRFATCKRRAENYAEMCC